MASITPVTRTLIPFTIRIVLGGLLIATAAAKLYGLGVTAVPQVGWFAQPWVQLAAAEWEVVLGLWLLAGAYPICSWAAAIATFAAFAAVSGSLGWSGVASCGCFGVIEASPWWAFGVDVTAVAVLSLARPAGKDLPPSRAMIATAGMTLAVLVAAVAVGSAVYGSPQAALARLRGELITVTPTHTDAGAGVPGTRLQSRVEVKNWSERTVRLVGGTSDCSCVTHHDLPVAIPPGESRWVTVELRVPTANVGRLTKRAELFTDHDRQPLVHFTIGCRVE
jgi:hypothetical protein